MTMLPVLITLAFGFLAGWLAGVTWADRTPPARDIYDVQSHHHVPDESELPYHRK